MLVTCIQVVNAPNFKSISIFYHQALRYQGFWIIAFFPHIALASLQVPFEWPASTSAFPFRLPFPFYLILSHFLSQPFPPHPSYLPLWPPPPQPVSGPRPTPGLLCRGCPAWPGRAGQPSVAGGYAWSAPRPTPPPSLTNEPCLRGSDGRAPLPSSFRRGWRRSQPGGSGSGSGAVSDCRRPETAAAAGHRCPWWIAAPSAADCHCPAIVRPLSPTGRCPVTVNAQPLSLRGPYV